MMMRETYRRWRQSVRGEKGVLDCLMEPILRREEWSLSNFREAGIPIDYFLDEILPATKISRMEAVLNWLGVSPRMEPIDYLVTFCGVVGIARREMAEKREQWFLPAAVQEEVKRRFHTDPVDLASRGYDYLPDTVQIFTALGKYWEMGLLVKIVSRDNQEESRFGIADSLKEIVLLQSGTETGESS